VFLLATVRRTMLVLLAAMMDVGMRSGRVRLGRLAIAARRFQPTMNSLLGRRAGVMTDVVFDLGHVVLLSGNLLLPQNVIKRTLQIRLLQRPGLALVRNGFAYLR